MREQGQVGQEVMFMQGSTAKYVSGRIVEVIVTNRKPLYRLDSGDVVPSYRAFIVKNRITEECAD